MKVARDPDFEMHTTLVYHSYSVSNTDKNTPTTPAKHIGYTLPDTQTHKKTLISTGGLGPSPHSACEHADKHTSKILKHPQTDGQMLAPRTFNQAKHTQTKHKTHSEWSEVYPRHAPGVVGRRCTGCCTGYAGRRVSSPWVLPGSPLLPRSPGCGRLAVLSL